MGGGSCQGQTTGWYRRVTCRVAPCEQQGATKKVWTHIKGFPKTLLVCASGQLLVLRQILIRDPPPQQVVEFPVKLVQINSEENKHTPLQLCFTNRHRLIPVLRPIASSSLPESNPDLLPGQQAVLNDCFGTFCSKARQLPKRSQPTRGSFCKWTQTQCVLSLAYLLFLYPALSLQVSWCTSCVCLQCAKRRVATPNNKNRLHLHQTQM